MSYSSNKMLLLSDGSVCNSDAYSVSGSGCNSPTPKCTMSSSLFQSNKSTDSTICESDCNKPCFYMHILIFSNANNSIVSVTNSILVILCLILCTVIHFPI